MQVIAVFGCWWFGEQVEHLSGGSACEAAKDAPLGLAVTGESGYVGTRVGARRTFAA